MENNTIQRPTFLTILCILTWIACGIGIITGAIGLIGAAAITKLLGSNVYMINSVVGILCTIACLVGSIQMWKMKKQGFYIYAAGEIIPVISGFILMADVAEQLEKLDGGLSGISAIMAGGGILGAIFPVAFVVMYYLNLKHMN